MQRKKQNRAIGSGDGRTIAKKAPSKPPASLRPAVGAAPNAAQPRVRDEWKADIVKDATTNRATLIVTFPTVGGEIQELRVPAEDREDLRKIRRQLLGYDAALLGDAGADMDLIQDLFATVDRVPLIEVNKPGFTSTGKGFVLGRLLLGDAEGGYWWRDPPDAKTVGAQGGTKRGWDEAAALLRHSSFLTLAVLAIVASPIRRYMELRASASRPRAPLISETATFNFVGKSSSGKTLAGQVAASVTGHKDSASKWDFSRRGLEEFLSSRNEVGAIFDDMEKHTGEDLPLDKAIKAVTQYVPGGSSKEISRMVAFDPRTWDTFGLSSAVLRTDEILPRRSDGEKVRFVDLIVPQRERGGIIDTPPPNVDLVEFAKRTVKRIEAVIAVNYGKLFPVWINLLLAQDQSRRLAELTEHFVREMAVSRSGYAERYARKFGILYAVGQIAVEHRLLPWPRSWPMEAVARCYRNAIAAARRDNALTAQALARLQQAVRAGRFPPARGEQRGDVRALNRDDFGVLHRHCNVDVVAVLDRGLQEIARDRRVAKTLVARLKAAGVWAGTDMRGRPRFRSE